MARLRRLGAEIVPESAPARAVRTREEEIAVHLQRYGADIIMDTVRDAPFPSGYVSAMAPLTLSRPPKEPADDAGSLCGRI